MLLGRTPCCTAVKRKLRVPSEEIWITDKTLAWAFQRLCLLSRPSRRHGTSVPGPMECRRRLGKRRMAHFSEAVRPPAHDFAALWGFRGAKENNIWQWEAPHKPPERAATDQLPSWLMDLDQSRANNPNQNHLESNDGLVPVLQSNATDDLEWFRDRIRAKTTPIDFSDICGTFCQTFKQSLSLGQVSAAVLAGSIREVPRLIRDNTASKDIEHALCISFYQATWRGIMACKVLRPAEIEPEVLRLLLTNLPRLPVHMSAALISDILRSITDKQKHELKKEIYAIGASLFSPDTSASHPEEISQSTETAKAKYSPPRKMFLNIYVLKDIVGALMETFGLYAPEKQAREEICHLVQLSTAYASRVIFSGSGRSTEVLVREGEDLRTTLLKLIARGPFASEALLVQACMIIRAEYRDDRTTITLPRLRQHVLCDIMFEYWAGTTPNTSIVKAHAAFKASFLCPHKPHRSIIHLCTALKQQAICWDEKVACYLRMLRRIRGESDSVYYCLKRLEQAKIYLNAPTIMNEMAALYTKNLRHAAKLQRLYSRDRPRTYEIPLEKFPGLAIAMIHDPSCNPRDIFDLLGGFRVWKETHTSWARIRLVEKMAFEFSQVDFISNRVALRSIAWCIRYLNHHKVPISSLIIRVLTDIGIEGNIIEKGSISRGRLQWVLGIIERTEGKVVAERIEAVVVDALHRERERRAREDCVKI